MINRSEKNKGRSTEVLCPNQVLAVPAAYVRRSHLCVACYPRTVQRYDEILFIAGFV